MYEWSRVMLYSGSIISSQTAEGVLHMETEEFGNDAEL